MCFFVLNYIVTSRQPWEYIFICLWGVYGPLFAYGVDEYGEILSDILN